VLYNARTLVEDSMMSRRGPEIHFVSRVEPALVLRNAWAWERVLINLFCNAVQACRKEALLASTPAATTAAFRSWSR